MGTSALDAASQFARLAVMRGLATPEHVMECLQALYSMASQGITPLPKLGDLLVQRGYISSPPAEVTKNIKREFHPPTRPAAPEPVEGERIGKYIKAEKLGEGGMGQVWKAWDTQLRRWVALKFLKAGSEEDLAYFRREAQTAAKLAHPNIAAVYEAHPSYIAMQWVDGEILSRVPKDDPRLIVEILRQAATALQYAHEQGVIHRDLKPANIMVVRPDKKQPTTRRISGSSSRSISPLQVFVMDFGLAKPTDVDSSLSVEGKILGTPKYMSPEQAKGHISLDFRADVYSLGATLYEMLGGEPPFEDANIYRLLRKVVEQEPKPLRKLKPALDPDLDTIVMKCLEKEPGRRYASAGELADDLRRWLDGEAILAHPPSITYRSRKWVQKNTWAWWAAAAALAAGIGLWVATSALSGAGREKQSIELVQKAERLYEAGRYDPARSMIGEALSVWPDSPEAKYWLARLSIREYQARRGVPEARIVRGLVELTPPRPESDEERRLREQAEEALHGVPGVSMANGVLALWSGDLDRALESFLRVKPDEPGSWEAEFYLGITHYLRGEFDSALLSLSKHRGRDPAVTLPVWIRALIASAQQKERIGLEFGPAYTQAQAACFELGGRAARLLEAQALISWGRAEASQGRDPAEKYSKAVELLQGLDDFEAHATRGDAFLGRAEHLRSMGRLAADDPPEYREAIESYLRADYGPGHLRRADAYLARYSHLKSTGKDAKEDLRRAMEAYAKSLEHNRGYADASIGLAEAAFQIEAESGNAAYEQEIKSLTEVIAAHPRYPPAFRARGLVWNYWGVYRLAQGLDPAAQFQSAIDDGARAIAVNPKDAEAYLLCGAARQNLGKARASRGEDAREFFLAAIADFGRALQVNPKEVGAFRARAAARLNLGADRESRGEDPISDYQSAIEDAGRGIEINPAYADVFYGRGAARQKLGAYRRNNGQDAGPDCRAAVEDLTRAIELNPRSAPAYTCRAHARFDGAVSMELHGADPIAEYKAAVEDANAAIELDPHDAETLRLRGSACRNVAHYLLSRGKDPLPFFQTALAELSKSLRANSKDAATWKAVSDTYQKMGMYREMTGEDPTDEYEKSIDAADHAVEVNAKDGEALGLRGFAHQSLAKFLAGRGRDPRSEYEKALKDLDRAVDANGKDPEAFRMRGAARQNLAFYKANQGDNPTEEFRAALEDLTQALRLNSKDAETYRFRGVVRQNLGRFRFENREDPSADYRDALIDFTRAIDLNPKDGEAFRFRGGTHYNAGQAMEARGESPIPEYALSINDLSKALEINASDAEAFLLRGFTHVMAGNLPDAISDLNRAVELNPSLRERADPWLKRARR